MFFVLCTQFTQFLLQNKSSTETYSVTETFFFSPTLELQLKETLASYQLSIIKTKYLNQYSFFTFLLIKLAYLVVTLYDTLLSKNIAYFF